MGGGNIFIRTEHVAIYRHSWESGMDRSQVSYKYFLGEKGVKEERVPKARGSPGSGAVRQECFLILELKTGQQDGGCPGRTGRVSREGLVGRGRVLGRHGMHRGIGSVLKAEGTPP